MLDAGSVEATLGGQFHPAGFLAFDKAMKSSGTHVTGFEKALLRTTTRGSTALRTLGTAAGYGAAGGVAALGVALVATVKKAGDFESQMSTLKAVTSANTREMALFRAQALKAGADTKYSALQAAQAQTELAKGGLSVSQIMKGGLKAALALAAAGDLELADAATFTANALNLFGLKGKDTMKVADQLATAANATTADVKDFGMALTQGGTAARAAGLDFTNTVAILEALASIGVKNSDAGTSLKTTLSQLASPTKKAAGLMDEMGLKFFDAHGKMKSVVDISAMLREKWSGLTKEQRLAAASTLAGTDGMRTLLALYQVGPAKIEGFERGLQKQGSAAKVAAEKQDNLKGKIENLKGSIETAAIVVGSALIPELTKLATGATNAINHLAATGQLQHFAEGLAHGLADVAGAAAHALPTVIDGIRMIGQVAGFSIHTIEAIVNALGGFDVVGPGILGAIAGLMALRGLQAVVPPLLAVVGAVKDLQLAFSAGGLAFAGETLLSMINPATALAAAFAGLGAAIAILITRESHEEQVAKQVAAAKREQAAATRELANLEDSAAHSVNDAKQAHLDLFAARRNLTEVTKQYGKGSHEYRQALLDERQAGLRWTDAHKQMVEQRRKLDASATNEAVPSMKRLTTAEEELYRQEQKIEALRKAGHVISKGDEDRLLAAARREVAAATKAAAVATDLGVMKEISLQRAMQGVEPIANKNRQAISLLTSVLNKVPDKKRTKLEADDQDALAKIGRLVPKLIAYGRLEKAAKLLANSSNAEAGLRRVKGLLDSIQSKTINVQINESHSGGGGAYGINKPAKGHASGARVDRPEYFQAGEDFNREYIIPVEGAHRGRGMELWMQAGHDLGIPGFKKGKKPKKKHRTIPPARDPLSLPVDTFDTDERNAQTKYDDAVRKVNDLERESNLKGKTYAGRRAKARKALPDARKKRTELKAKLKARQQELRDAKHFAADIKKQEDLVEIARNAMELADKQDDQKGFDSATTKRGKALERLKALYQKALGHIRADTPYSREIQKALGQTLVDVQDLSTTENEPETSTTEEPPTLLTDDQQAQLDAIEKAIALDEINTPDDTTDDVRDTKDLVSFWEGMVQSLSDAGAGDSFITEAARNVKQARDQLASLTQGTPGGNGTNPDLEAQLAQANRRADVAEESARISSGALNAFSGAGDLGFGRGFAVQQNIYTLHPGDPATLDAIGKASTAGIDLRTSRQSPREFVGV